MNRPNPQQRNSTRVRAVAPAPAGRPTTRVPAPAMPAPELAAPPPRPAAAPARPAPARPVARTIVKSGAGFFTKAFIWLLLLAIGAAVGGAYWFKTDDGIPLAEAFIEQGRAKLVKFGLVREEPAAAAPKFEIDEKVKAALDARAKTEAYVKDTHAAEVQIDSIPPEKAAEIVRELKGSHERTLQGAAVLTAALEEFQKPRRQRKTGLDGAKLGAELRKQGDVAKELGALGQRWVEIREQKLVKKAEDDRKAAEAARPPPPPPVAFDFKKYGAWGGAAKETWVRWKHTAGETVTYEDQIVRTVTDEAIVVARQGFVNGKATDLGDLVTAIPAGKILREEMVQVGDANIACVVVESGTTLRWIAKDGRAANRVIVKAVGGGQTTTLSGIGESEASVKGQAKACVRYESGGTKVWIHEDVPGLLVRIENDRGVSEVVDCGSDLASRPEFPKPTRSAEAIAAQGPVRPHPWSTFKVGSWTRRRAFFKGPTATSERTADTVIVEVSPAEVALKHETLALDGGVAATEQRISLTAEANKVVGEETLSIGGVEYACVIVESLGERGPQKAWVPKEGRAGALSVALKLEAMNLTKKAVAVSERTVQVAGRELQCLRVLSEGTRDDGPIREELCFSEEVPGYEVLREVVTRTELGEAHATISLFAFGDNPARKTPIGLIKEDPATVELRRVFKVLDEAEKFVIEASVIYRELAATREIPPEAAKKRELLRKSDEAAALFTRARETYGTVKDRAPAEAGLEEKLGKIEKVLVSIVKYQETIKGTLK